MQGGLNVRVLTGLMLLMLLALPDLARSQSFEVYGSAGPTITDAGHSFAAGAGFSPTSRLTFLASFERTHLSTQTSFDGQVFSAFRGGTLSIGTAELRVTPLGRSRFGPYGLAGFAAGVSRPNVNEQFPDPVTNDVRALFVGGGVQVPLGARLAAFGDVRMLFGSEGIEGIVAVAPVRAGITFRF
jgi:hypothetical protein